MAVHTEDSLRCSGISQVLNLLLAVPTAEAIGAKGLVSGEDGQVFDFVPTGTTAVCTIVADERAIAEQEEVGIGVEKGLAGVASKTFNVPSLASWKKNLSAPPARMLR